MEKQTMTFILYDENISNGDLEVDLYIPFVPKKFTISNLRYISNFILADKETGLVFLKSNIATDADDGTLMSFYDGCDSLTPITFKCRPNINGRVKFSYDEVNGHDGELSFAITFED